jgi:glycerol-3-phosphate acyltransferase PlsY
MIPAVGAAILGFVLGSIPFSWILAWLAGGLDIRAVGSGNVGATNVARSLGYRMGAVALLLDAAKGAAAVLSARVIAPGQAGAALAAGGLAVLGHMFTPFLRGHGGKGVATGAGVFAVLAPQALGIAIAVFAVTLAAGRMVSLGSVLAAAVLVIARHRDNLARIARGTERRFGARDGR